MMDAQYVFRSRCDAIEPPSPDNQDSSNPVDRQDSFELEDDSQRLPLTDGTIMTSANVIDLLKVDNNHDTLCRLPPTSQLLGPQNPQFRATQTTMHLPADSEEPERCQYNGKYPTLGLHDHNEEGTRPSYRGANKQKLWAPSPDTMVDDNGKVVQYYVNQAHIDHATRYYNQQASGVQREAVSDSDDGEQSWTRHQMAIRLANPNWKTAKFAKKVRQVMEREEKIGRLGAEDAANVLTSITRSDEAFVPPTNPVNDAADSLIEMSKATSLTAQPRQMDMTLAEFEASLKDGLKSMAPIDRNEIVALIDKAEPPFARVRCRRIDVDAPGSFERCQLHERSIPGQATITPLAREQDTEGPQPMRRIARRNEDLYHRDNYPEWAKRIDKKGRFLLPDQETRDAQRKVMAFSMRFRNHVEDKPLESGLDQVDHFLEPAWEVDGAEEFDVIQSEPNVLCKLFDEPERPIGAFDPVEVDYWMELERQKHLTKWRKQGYSEEEINGFQQEFWKKTPAELDARGKAAREAMIASRKLLVVPPLPKQSAPSMSKKRKGKQPLRNDEEEDDFGEGSSGLRRSKRAKLSAAQPEEISPTTVKRLDDELDQLLGEESDGQEAPLDDERNSRRSSQDSNSLNGSGKKITFKLGGRHIRTFTYNPPPSDDQEHTGETTEDASEETEDVGEETEDSMYWV